jgi:hypothetical protein
MKKLEKREIEKQARDFERFLGKPLSKGEREYLELCIGHAYNQGQIDFLERGVNEYITNPLPTASYSHGR